jgi:hypothetical protein
MMGGSSQEVVMLDELFVTVFETGDAALIPLVRSLLEAEGIEYVVHGEQVQDLIGVGRMRAGFNVLTGPAEFLVRPADAERARELLRDLAPPAARAEHARER